MEELKYYTPDISELYVGCQYYLKDKGFHINDVQTINSLQDMWTLHHLGVENILVSYLTKEQIEAELEMSEICFIFAAGNNVLTLIKNNQTVFKGICKSKNELRKVLEYIK